MDTVDQMNATPNLDEKELLAERYWRGGEPSFAPEVIVEGSVRVCGRWGPSVSMNRKILDQIKYSKAQGVLALSPETKDLLSQFGVEIEIEVTGEVRCEQVGPPRSDLFNCK